MKLKGIEIKFVSKELDGPMEVTAPLTEEGLISAQNHFRSRVTTILERAYERELDFFEMSGIDNRFLDFPTVGAAKIIAQEFLKLIKKDDVKLKNVEIIVPDKEQCATFEKVFDGYVHHVIGELGKEPFPTCDIIIELPEGIILIERSNPPYGWALPGGFIDHGEETKAAAIREAKEETNMDLEDVRKLGVYDKDGRDPRFRTSSTVYVAKGVGTPQFGDDAKGLKIVKYEDLTNLKYAFDHNEIIRDYLKQKG